MTPPFSSHSANFVFQLCRPGLRQLPEITLEEGTVDAVVSFAARNGVAPWCFHRLTQLKADESPIFQELTQQLKKQYLQALVMNQQRWQVFREIKGLLDANQIEAIPLKGLALAFTLYPQEALRPMGDLDLLIHPDKVYMARDILIDHGATPLNVPLSRTHEKIHAHVPALSWKGIMVEPHQRLFALGSPLNPASIDLFNQLTRAGGTHDFRVFNDAMMTYHLAAHLIKGYKMGGMRLSWLLDLALMLQRNQNSTHFFNQVTNLHPPAKNQIIKALEWASLLLMQKPTAHPLTHPMPNEALFRHEHNTRQKHKKIVLHETMHLPGIKLKAGVLFRELFPSRTYMEHYYGKQPNRGRLWLLYLKRIAGQARK